MVDIRSLSTAQRASWAAAALPAGEAVGTLASQLADISTNTLTVEGLSNLRDINVRDTVSNDKGNLVSFTNYAGDVQYANISVTASNNLTLFSNGGQVVTGVPLTVTGNAQVNGTINATGPIIGTGELRVRDSNGSRGSNNITFYNNALSVSYGNITANAAGNIALASTGAGKVQVVSNLQCDLDVTVPNMTGSAGGVAVMWETGALRKSTSSRRYKANIVDLPEVSPIIDRLRPVAYTSTLEHDDKKRVRYGLIAEEVNKLDKAYVAYDEHGKPDGLNYIMLVPLLLKEIQGLRKRVAALEAG